MVPGMSAIVVVTTVGNEEQANTLARELVERRHAACVNLIPAVRSVYRWQGKICKDSEFMLIVKSQEEEFEAVAATIRELHSYDLPEILAFEVKHGDQAFLGWIAASLDKEAAFSDETDEGVALHLDDTSF
jgi:periplasmic divalent cation tolerance protein